MVPIVTVLRRTSVRIALTGALAGAVALPVPTAGGAFTAPAATVLPPGLRAEIAAGDVTPVDVPEADRPAVAATPDQGPGARRPTGPAGNHGRSTRVGKNHVWSADLGLNRPVSWFPCSRSQPPAMAVYRWGCAGANNVYLFAHAGGPFGRLHDMYVRGRLRRGMTVTYADARGKVHRYRVAWWRVVLPTQGDFAFAALARSSMTLQTCVGAHDRYRLVVRLRQDD